LYYVTVYLIRIENKINIDFYIEISQIHICDFWRLVIAIIQQLLISLSGRISPNSLRRTRIIFRK